MLFLVFLFICVNANMLQLFYRNNKQLQILLIKLPLEFLVILVEFMSFRTYIILIQYHMKNVNFLGFAILNVF